MPHLDLLPGDLVRVRNGKNAGKVGVVITSLYKTYSGKTFKKDPSLTYCVKDPGSNITIFTCGTNLIRIGAPAINEDITIYAW